MFIFSKYAVYQYIYHLYAGLVCLVLLPVLIAYCMILLPSENSDSDVEINLISSLGSQYQPGPVTITME